MKQFVAEASLDGVGVTRLFWNGDGLSELLIPFLFSERLQWKRSSRGGSSQRVRVVKMAFLTGQGEVVLT